MKFVDEGPRLRRSRRQASDQRSRKLSDDDINPTFSVSSVAEDSTSHEKHYFQWKYQSHELKSFALERDQVLSSFVSAMFPLGVHSVQSSLLGCWLWHVPPRLGCSTSLDYGALSLALVYFARVSEGELLFRSAEVSYTMALKSLAVDIAHPSKRLSSEVLCATLLLGHYEVCSHVHSPFSITDLICIRLDICQCRPNLDPTRRWSGALNAASRCSAML